MEEEQEFTNGPFLVPPSHSIKEPSVSSSRSQQSAPRFRNQSKLSAQNEQQNANANYRRSEKNTSNIRRRKKKQDYNPLDFMLDENSSQASKIATRLLYGDTIKEHYPPDLYNIVIRDLEHRRDVFMLKGSFDEALKASEAAVNARQLQINATKKEEQEYELADVLLRKGHMKTDVSIFKHVTQAEFNDLKEKNEMRLKRMKERHQKELEAHEKKWNDPAMQRLYNRRSKELQELRTLENRLLQVGRSADAAVAKKRADQMEMNEYNESRWRFENDYKASRDLLLQKQANEIDTFEKSVDVKKLAFKNKVSTKKRAFTNRNRILKHQEDIANDPDKVWRKKHRGERDVVVHGARKEGARDMTPASAILLPPLDEKKSARR